jgi:MFS transporter, OFA family, oxalate/formate antiporter
LIEIISQFTYNDPIIMIDSKPRAKAKPSWGWMVVVGATIMTFGFYGASGSFGVFLKPIEESLNLTRASASSAMSTFMAIFGLSGIISGRLTDKYGPRIVIGAGAVIGCLGYLLMSRASSLWQIHLFFGVVAGASMGTCFTPLVTTISKWFIEKRVLAIGITTIGISLGQMTVPIIAAFLIAGNGWQPAYIILAIVVLITSIPAAILLGKKPQSYTQEIDIKTSRPSIGLSAGEAVRTVPFWMFIIIGIVNASGFYIILVHIVAYAIGLGILAVDSALILTFINIGSIMTPFLVWYLARRIGSRFTLISMLGIQAVAFFFLLGTTGFYYLAIVGLIFGFGFGGSNTIRISTIPEIFGTRSAGAIIGLISVAWSIGGIIGPILAGYIYDVSHSYSLAFLIGGLLLTIGVVAGFFLKPPVPATTRIPEH